MTEAEYLEYRRKRNEANRRYYSKPEVKEKKAKYKKDYEKKNKKRISEYGKELRSRPEYKERIKKWREENKEHLREYNKRPDRRKKKRIADRKYYNKMRQDKNKVLKERQRLKKFRENNPKKILIYKQKYYASEKGIKNYTKHNHRRIALIKARPFNLTERKIKQIVDRDKECVYCGSDKKLELDHIIPLKLGGNSLFENFVLACAKCNRSKSGREVSDWCKIQGIKIPNIVLQQLDKMRV